MSAYICEPKTIDAIASALAHLTTATGDSMASIYGRPFLDLPRPYAIDRPESSDFELARLAFDLHRLNCRAVDARYNEANRADYRPTIGAAPTWKETEEAAACLLYQCAEGDIPKTPLFQALNFFHQLVATSPELAKEKRLADRAAQDAAKKAHAEECARIAAEYGDWLELAEHSTKSDHALAAANIRRELKKAFPGHKFRVRSSSFSMGNDVTVSWLAGPTTKEVDAIVSKYQEGSFDGMTDSYSYHDTPWPAVFGGAKYVSTQREMPDGLVKAMAASLRQHHGESVTDWDLERIAYQVFGAHSYPPAAEFTGEVESYESAENISAPPWRPIVGTKPEPEPKPAPRAEPEPQPEQKPATRGTDAFFDGWVSQHQKIADEFLDGLRSRVRHSIESQHLAIRDGAISPPEAVLDNALRFAIACQHAEHTAYGIAAARLLAAETLQECNDHGPAALLYFLAGTTCPSVKDATRKACHEILNLLDQ